MVGMLQMQELELPGWWSSACTAAVYFRDGQRREAVQKEGCRGWDDVWNHLGMDLAKNSIQDLQKHLVMTVGHMRPCHHMLAQVKSLYRLVI